MQKGKLSNWDTLTLGTNCQTVVTWRSLGIPLQQWCEFNCRYTCKWEYSLTGDTIPLGTNGQTVVTWQSLGILYNNGENTTADTHANGNTL